MRMIKLLTTPLLLALVALTGCARSGLVPPSLAPRTAEAIDPRLPVERALVERPVSNTMRARLSDLIGAARTGEAAFRAALGPAERAAAAAGPARSESWISAQEALSALQAARTPTPRALSAIDALAGETIAATGGIGAADRAAIDEAASEVGVIDRQQSATIKSLAARLGS